MSAERTAAWGLLAGAFLLALGLMDLPADPPDPRGKSKKPDSASSGDGIGSTTPKEREERQASTQDRGQGAGLPWSAQPSAPDTSAAARLHRFTPVYGEWPVCDLCGEREDAPIHKQPEEPSAAKSGTPDRCEFAPESVPTEPKEREERQDRATRCFSAFLASLSTLLGYEINPWLGWGWLVCLGVIYAYTEVVS